MRDKCVAHPCVKDRVKKHAFCPEHLLDYMKPSHYRIPKTKKEAGVK